MKMPGWRRETPPLASGTSISVLRANSVKLGGMARIMPLPIAKSTKPWNMLNVPSVTISVGNLKREMKNALMKPSPSPIAPERMKATHMGASTQ